MMAGDVALATLRDNDLLGADEFAAGAKRYGATVACKSVLEV
jgi:hypothetical protein